MAPGQTPHFRRARLPAHRSPAASADAHGKNGTRPGRETLSSRLQVARLAGGCAFRHARKLSRGDGTRRARLRWPFDATRRLRAGTCALASLRRRSRGRATCPARLAGSTRRILPGAGLCGSARVLSAAPGKRTRGVCRVLSQINRRGEAAGPRHTRAHAAGRAGGAERGGAHANATTARSRRDGESRR